MTNRSPVLPGGGTIGILGGGQLGRMLALAARRAGYRTVLLDPQPDSPAGQVADRQIARAFDDEAAVAEFAAAADVATVEFENIPIAAMEAVAARIPLRPRPDIVAICQNREREKSWLRDRGFPVPNFAVCTSAESAAQAADQVGFPCVLKTAAFGYDGKGQVKITRVEEIGAAWENLGAPRGVVEAWVDFECEMSVIVARGVRGDAAAFDAGENRHAHHILDVTIAPAPREAALLRDARELAEAIAAALDLEGVLGVELFLARDGQLLVNELAPRTHNSGHHTIDACVTSQFEQQLRAVCGLPLGDPSLLRPAVMVNLLGDIWRPDGSPPDWSPVFADPCAHLHLYGKTAPRPKRKMGHFTVVAEDAIPRALRIQSALRAGS